MDPVSYEIGSPMSSEAIIRLPQNVEELWAKITTNGTEIGPAPMDPLSYETGSPMSSEAIIRQFEIFEELWAQIMTETGPAPREELQRAPIHGPHKRPRTPEPDPGAGPSQWIAESEGRGGADPPNNTKRRRVTSEERKAGDRAAAQRGEAHKTLVRRTP
jgi:hypothetical protein